jgi:hypothetical protein
MKRIIEMERLLKRLTADILEAVEDAADMGEDPLCRIRPRRSGKPGLVIETRRSRTGLNQDGGDYDHWVVVIPHANGIVELRRDWSCQLQSYGEPPEFFRV